MTAYNVIKGKKAINLDLFETAAFVRIFQLNEEGVKAMKIHDSLNLKYI